MAYTVIGLFFSSFLWSGVQHILHIPKSVRNALDEPLFLPGLSKEAFKGFPDLSHYVNLRTIAADELALDDRRLIFVGDIHGMKSSIDTLLSTLSYDPSRDVLLHLGDFIAKGSGSQQVLSQFSEANITGVRGNHEQQVIEWRAWIEWVEAQANGKRWLEKLEKHYPHGFEAKKNHKPKWPIPEGWQFMQDHYKIARRMSASEYSYLKSLPLVIHLPSLHTLAVHAGLLPFDPEYPPDAPHQPLTHTPFLLSPPSSLIRNAQQLALLTNITQNADPWVLLNMRSVLNNGTVSRGSDKGTPWADLWNMIMSQCRGFHSHDTDGTTLEFRAELKPRQFELSCLPITVVYGHAASRGLDIKRWSFGLDTGCVKGRKLTAMVLSDLDAASPAVTEHTRKVPFGQHRMAQLVSVHCLKHS